jgi:hypothetical protein
MRLRALAAGATIALLTPVLGALLGGTWYLFTPPLAGGVAGYLSAGDQRKGFAYGAGSGLLAFLTVTLVTLVAWLASLLGLFGQTATEGAVHVLRGAFMLGPILAVTVPFLVVGVVLVLVVMGLAGALATATR